MHQFILFDCPPGLDDTCWSSCTWTKMRICILTLTQMTVKSIKNYCSDMILKPDVVELSNYFLYSSYYCETLNVLCHFLNSSSQCKKKQTKHTIWRFLPLLGWVFFFNHQAQETFLKWPEIADLLSMLSILSYAFKLLLYHSDPSPPHQMHFLPFFLFCFYEHRYVSFISFIWADGCH